MAQSFRQEILGNLCSRDELAVRIRWLKDRVRKDMAILKNEHERREYYAALDTEFCRRSFYYFLTRHWMTVWTEGPEHGADLEALYPASRMAWLMSLILHVCRHDTIDIVKSRQAPMMSHLMAAHFFWRSLFHPGRMDLFHSKSLIHVGQGGHGNSQTLMGRCEVGYHRLPRYLQSVAPVEFSLNSQRPQITFLHRSRIGDDIDLTSKIMGVPDTFQADQTTSWSPSGELDDERGHQKDPKGHYETASPAMQDRLFVRVGTCDSEHFPEALQDMRSYIGGTEDADGNPETDWEELMPYNDSYQGGFLKQIYEDVTDHELGFRFLGRRRRNGYVTLKIHFRARAGFGKTYRREVVNRIQDPVRRAEEHDCEMYAINAEHRMWRLSEYGSRHYEYDSKQTGEFARIIRILDYGKRSAAQFWQKVKMGPLPGSYQLRCLGEVCTNGPLVREVCKMVHERMVQWFPDYDYRVNPCLDNPDVAGRQSNRQTGQTDIQVTIDEMKKYEPLFHVQARRIGTDEGVDEIYLKCQEILGYDENGHPIPGLVVSPMRAPVTHRALQGALRQDGKGRISKSKENAEYEHVGDDIRMLGAQFVRRSDIVRDGMVVSTTAAPAKVAPTLAEKQERVSEWMDRSIDEAFEKMRSAPVEVTRERFYDEV